MIQEDRLKKEIEKINNKYNVNILLSGGSLTEDECKKWRIKADRTYSSYIGALKTFIKQRELDAIQNSMHKLKVKLEGQVIRNGKGNRTNATLKEIIKYIEEDCIQVVESKLSKITKEQE